MGGGGQQIQRLWGSGVDKRWEQGETRTVLIREPQLREKEKYKLTDICEHRFARGNPKGRRNV